MLATPHACTFDSPAAVDALGLCYYAGFAFLTPAGQAMGTLCVIDRQPRFLEPEKAVLLRELADVALWLPDLQATLATSSAPALALWSDVYAAISASLNRLNTLAKLRKGEDSADTSAALNY